MIAMDQRNLTSCVDVIVVSGHGITSATTDSTNSIYLEKFWQIHQDEKFVSGAVGRLGAIKKG